MPRQRVLDHAQLARRVAAQRLQQVRRLAAVGGVVAHVQHDVGARRRARRRDRLAQPRLARVAEVGAAGVRVAKVAHVHLRHERHDARRGVVRVAQRRRRAHRLAEDADALVRRAELGERAVPPRAVVVLAAGGVGDEPALRRVEAVGHRHVLAPRLVADAPQRRAVLGAHDAVPAERREDENQRAEPFGLAVAGGGVRTRSAQDDRRRLGGGVPHPTECRHLALAARRARRAEQAAQAELARWKPERAQHRRPQLLHRAAVQRANDAGVVFGRRRHGHEVVLGVSQPRGGVRLVRTARTGALGPRRSERRTACRQELVADDRGGERLGHLSPPLLGQPSKARRGSNGLGSLERSLSCRDLIRGAQRECQGLERVVPQIHVKQVLLEPRALAVPAERRCRLAQLSRVLGQRIGATRARKHATDIEARVDDRLGRMGASDRGVQLPERLRGCVGRCDGAGAHDHPR